MCNSVAILGLLRQVGRWGGPPSVAPSTLHSRAALSARQASDFPTLHVYASVPSASLPNNCFRFEWPFCFSYQHVPDGLFVAYNPTIGPGTSETSEERVIVRVASSCSPTGPGTDAPMRSRQIRHVARHTLTDHRPAGLRARLGEQAVACARAAGGLCRICGGGCCGRSQRPEIDRRCMRWAWITPRVVWVKPQNSHRSTVPSGQVAPAVVQEASTSHQKNRSLLSIRRRDSGGSHPQRRIVDQIRNKAQDLAHVRARIDASMPRCLDGVTIRPLLAWLKAMRSHGIHALALAAQPLFATRDDGHW